MFWQQLAAACSALVQAPDLHWLGDCDSTREPLEWLFARGADAAGLAVRYHTRGVHPDYLTTGPFDLEIKGMQNLGGYIQLNSTPPGTVHGSRRSLLLLFHYSTRERDRVQIHGAAVLHPDLFYGGVFTADRNYGDTIASLGGDPFLAVRLRTMFIVTRLPRQLKPLVDRRAVLVLPEDVLPGPGFVPLDCITKTEAAQRPVETLIRYDGSAPETRYEPNPNAGRVHRYPVWTTAETVR